MTNEEAKELYTQATASMEAQNYEGALALLDQLDAARPNSRHVTYQRARCFLLLGRADDAAACCTRLEGKLDAAQFEELRSGVEALRQRTSEPEPVAEPAEEESGENVLVVEQVFPASTEETTVTGHVASGVFHTGDTVTIVTPDGMPLLAPIVRLGTAETPLKIVRAGQQVVALLRVEPNHVAVGSRLTSATQEQSYAETMVVSTDSGKESIPSAPHALLEIERMVKSGKLVDAAKKLEGHLEPGRDSMLAHRLMARILLDDEGLRDPKRALEHARRAFEMDGAEEHPVIDVLAAALAANGEAGHGLRFLERLYQKTNDSAARNALAQRITDFRTRNNLGHVWEFSDEYGSVVFESGDIKEIAKAISGGTVSKEGKCRRNRIGDWRNIETTLAAEYEEIGALYKPAGKGMSWLIPVITFVVVAAIIAVVLIMM